MQRFPVLFLLIAMVSIQLGASLAKSLFPVVGAPGVTIFRTLFAAIFLSLLWQPWRQPWSSAQLRILAIYGACLGAMNYLFYISLQTIPLGLAVGIEFTGPLTLSLVSSRKPLDFFWVILAAVGIYLILPQSALPGGSEAVLDPRGVAFALAAGFFWALYIWFGTKASQQGTGGRTTALGMGFAALTVLPFGLYHTGIKLFEGSLRWGSIASAIPFGLGIALLSSAIPYSIEMNALKRIPMKTFGILMSLEPVVATLMGFLILHEHLTALQMISIVCIVIASLGNNFTSKQAKPLLELNP
jgi:inner membrane transporter RhtA